MPFATEDLRYLYDQVYADADQIGTIAGHEPDDEQFRKDVHDLIRWRKGETDYPFDGSPDAPSSPGRLEDLGLPITLIGNNYPVVDARAFVDRGGRYAWRPKSAIVRGSIHHSAGPAPMTPEGVLGQLSAIAALHTGPTHNWPGYAYPLTIDPAGRPILTGDIDTLRYVVGDDNRNNVAICLLGDFTNHPPTAAQLATLPILMGETEFDIGRALDWMGHRETPRTKPTACPGATFDSWRPDRANRAPATLIVPSVREWAYQEMIDAIASAATGANVPAYFPVGAAIAESGPNQFAERYDGPALTAEGKRYAATGDLAGLQSVVDRMREQGTPYDISFGLSQQTVSYAPVGDGSLSPENILAVRAWAFDPANVIPVMVNRLAASFHERQAWGDPESEAVINALWKYNTGQYAPPSGQYAGNTANYLRALEHARTLL